jgi:hypothetical protein
VVQVCHGGVEGVADFLTLEGARSSVDGKLSHDLGDVESSLLSLECLVALDKVLHLGGDQGNVGAEGILGETKLDELRELARPHTARYVIYTFFCSMSFEFGQSYTTSLPKTGVQSGA